MEGYSASVCAVCVGRANTWRFQKKLSLKSPFQAEHTPIACPMVAEGFLLMSLITAASGGCSAVRCVYRH